ncbi:hypothetical protein PHYPSEUDO_013621 [Phytophthora pseudosyringae]|uniref:Protein kinase domain-containing protein n=1 Tax=Phytophthora pseudosyringae TaxID=221518 RepID=A0A8T1W6N9_9STRA|nr:hypothetical protein PHYPSEUDO_013621 [Phytophthora pseudosyringae]
MSLGRWLFRAVAVAPLLATPSIATNWSAREIYSGSHCAGTPNVLKMIETDTCEPQACAPHDLGGYTLFVTAACNVTDRFKFTHERFQGFDYVMMEEYGGTRCEHLVQTTVYPASGTCEKSSALANTSDIVSLYSNGTAVVLLFDDGACGSNPSLQFELDSEKISNGDCIQDRYRFYTGTASGSTDSSSSAFGYESSQQFGGRSFDGGSSNGLSWGTTAGIVAGSAACVAFLAFATFKFVRRRYDDNLTKDTGIAALAASYAGYPTPESALNAITLGSEASYSQGSTEEEGKPRSRRNNMSGLSGMWDDEIIITARVPREKVIVQDLISRGGYGEVYSALFNDEPVAVKMLLPEMRKSISHLNAFLAEPRIALYGMVWPRW